MSSYSVEASSLNKAFGRRLIFDNLNFSYSGSGIYGITGANGSGKSTLVKIIAGINSPTGGKVTHKIDGTEIPEEKLQNHIGFVSPYLVMYDEFSLWENMTHFAAVRGTEFNRERVEYYLDKFLLFNRRNDLVKTYSSGMKQRVKFIFALMHSPDLLILDEPTSNLDEEGKNSVYNIIEEEGKRGIVMVASNERNDLALCRESIKLEDFKVIYKAAL